MKQAETEFEALQKTADPEILKAAHKLSERFTCPMHPDVIGRKTRPVRSAACRSINRS